MRIELVEGGELPRYGNDGDACVDFFAREDVEWTVTSGIHTALVPLGVKVKVPNGYGLFLFSRSGMGFNNNITLINSVGVIDKSYRNELMCKLVWQGVGFAFPQPITKGQRVCQGCIIETPRIYFDVVDDIGEGKAGFGSSGS
jgi:dUTP pyrophosphatase